MPPRVDAAVEERVRASVMAGKSLRTAAGECGVSTTVVQRVMGELGDAQDEARIEAIVARMLGKSLINPGLVAEVAPQVVERTPAKFAAEPRARAGATGKGSRLQPYLDALDLRYERLGERAREYPAPPSYAASGPYLVHMGLFDAHFGKLCWNPETGQDFDLRIAEAVYRHAADDLLRLLSPYAVGRFVLPIGNDLFHVDTLGNTTTAGTIVEADSRYPKMIDIGTEAVVQLIERLQVVAPVDLLYVPGNHDRLSSYHLCRELKREFRRSPGVTVDISPKVRKYRRYGSVLFGWRHGDLVTDSGLRELPGLMALEAAEDWSMATCREWFLGHRHTSRKFTTREGDETLGVQVRYLSSLSGTDAWHFENGFVGNRRAAEAYLYSLDSGYVGHFVSPARF